jgi:hypothetical protein
MILFKIKCNIIKMFEIGIVFQLYHNINCNVIEFSFQTKTSPLPTGRQADPLERGNLVCLN